MSNLYKNNLVFIKNITSNTYLSVDNNKLGIDNRYFTSFRKTYNTKDIVSTISLSFIHYLNLMRISKENTYLPLLQESLLGFKNYRNAHINDHDYDYINEYYLFIETELNKIESIDNLETTQPKPNLITKFRNFIVETVYYLLAFFIN